MGPSDHHWCSFNQRYQTAKRLPEHQSFSINGKDPTFFIPQSYVKRVLLTQAHIRSLLEENQLPKQNTGRHTTVLAEAIAEHSTTVFCILLLIDEITHIERFIEHQYRDGRLQYPDDKPALSLREQKWEEFKSVKTHFVAHCIEKAGITNVLDNWRPFPFIGCAELGTGHSSKVYRVRLHREFDGLRSDLPRRTDWLAAGDDTAIGHHEYALKVYGGRSAQERQVAEVTAFDTIRGQGKTQWPAGIIGYYGAYCVDDSNLRCIWLELATGGNLMQLFQEAPPLDHAVLCNFWIRLFELAEGLATLHGLMGRNSADPNDPILRSVHLDIHPRNILLVRDETVVNASHTCVQHKYKLADLGHSRTVETSANDSRPLFIDTKAGREFSAPEVHEVVPLEGVYRKHVSAKADVFPLGAVYLVAFIWTLHGPAGVKAFTEARMAECKNDIQENSRFHTAEGASSKLLSVVQDYINDDLNSLDASPVEADCCRKLLELIRNMLQPDLHERSTSVQAVSQAKRMAIWLASQTESSTLSPTSPSTSNHISPSTPIGPKRTFSVTTPKRDNTTHPGRRDTISTPYRGVQPNSRDSSSPQWSNLPNRTHNTGRITPTSSAMHNYQASTPAPISPVERASPQSITYASVHSSPVDERDMSREQPRQWPRSVDSRRSKREKVTVHEALEWKTAHKAARRFSMFKTRPPLRHSYLLDNVGNQDFIFVIDDSDNMGHNHKDDAIRAFAAMSYIIKVKDKDGIELKYTISGEEMQSKDTSRMIDHIKDHTFGDKTNMRSALERIIRPHRDKISKRTSKLFKGISIVMLTDGRWAPDDSVEEYIIEIAKFLRDQGLDRKALSISFVNFGTDKGAVAYMKALDNLEKHNKATLDIVDHEPATGDIYKMMLGGYDAGIDGGDDTSSIFSTSYG